MPEVTDSEDEDYESEEEDALAFEKIIGDTVLTGHRQGDTVENLTMEIKSAKFAHNKEFSDCIQGVVPSLLGLILEKANEISKGSEMVRIMTVSKKYLSKGGWGYGLLKPLLQEVVDGVSLIESIEDVALNVEGREGLTSGAGVAFYGVFRMMLQVLNDSELLSEEVLNEWIEERQGCEDTSEGVGKLFNEPSVQEFVEWLQEDSEEDDDDDEDED